MNGAPDGRQTRRLPSVIGRLLGRISSLSLIGVVISGCAAHPTNLELMAELRKLPAVSDVKIYGEDVVQSLGTAHYTEVDVTLSSANEVEDATDFARDLVQAGWAAKVSDRPTFISLDIAVSEGPPFDLDDALRAAGLKHTVGVGGANTAVVSKRVLERRWGRWPGDAPDLGDRG